jgi:hypothetical protein
MVPIVLGCTAVFCTLAGSAFANWITVIDQRPAAIELPAGGTLDPAATVEQHPPSREESVPEPAMDLYGNEVTDAVANYWLDSRGALYEEHSPQTEVPRLKAPES